MIMSKVRDQPRTTRRNLLMISRQLGPQSPRNLLVTHYTIMDQTLQRLKAPCSRRTGTARLKFDNEHLNDSEKAWEKVMRRTSCIEERMDGDMSRDILADSLLPSARTLTMGHGGVFQQDNDPEHSAKATQERLKKKHI
ncbi:hypothetical protein JOQ06_022257 [Pogonophryne albipinna]|uniref:Uncharacterized protein n=1 Tax=Pogonophryne albipinna TaxID=1090488 RepID=A0AAD6F293_9TELE|nr:hypothetical protein JOQ06_022257 [Pogonophryne albipinna]